MPREAPIIMVLSGVDARGEALPEVVVEGRIDDGTLRLPPMEWPDGARVTRLTMQRVQ